MSIAEIGLYLTQEQLNDFNGKHFVSCEPKDRIERIKPGIVKDRLAAIGKKLVAADEKGMTQFNVTLVDGFLTTFRNPDHRLLNGLGFDKVEYFQKSYGDFWANSFPKDQLTDRTELFVTIWKKASEEKV